MTNKNLYFFAIIFFVALAAGVAVWVFNATPGYSEKERYVLVETEALERDIAEIDAMEGGVEELEKKIVNVRGKIADRYAGRAVKALSASERVGEVCEKAGLEDAEIEISRARQVSPAGDYTPALYTAEVTIMFMGDDRKGGEVVRGLENTVNMDFEVTGFVCRLPKSAKVETGAETEVVTGEETGEEIDLIVVQGAPAGEWRIITRVYYYE